MKVIIIVLFLFLVIGIFGIYSYKCALRDRYLKIGDTENVFMWQREFWEPSGSTYKSISCSELPFVLISYWTKGRSQAKRWDEYFDKYLAGKTIDETSLIREAEIRYRIKHGF